MENFESTASDLLERIALHSERFKNDMNSIEFLSVDQFMYDFNMETEVFQFRICYEIDQFKKNTFELTKVASGSSNNNDPSKKNELLTKMQTVVSKIALHLAKNT